MRLVAIGFIVVLQLSLRATSLFSVMECPPHLEEDIIEQSKDKPLEISCTMQLLCPSSEKYSQCDTNDTHEPESKRCLASGVQAMCEMKLRVNIVRDSGEENETENPCPRGEYWDVPTLLPHRDNCSLFYKCDWGNPVLFECPEDLHFNAELQVCDWPWQAGCDSSWMGCPRPFPRCPKNYPRSLLLPHPQLCDRFYQCNWGTPSIQACPTGLHFNARLKVCDWPHNTNCLIC